MIEYRVIDHFALWYFSVERCLNDMAQQGWEYVDLKWPNPGTSSNMVLILKRTKK